MKAEELLGALIGGVLAGVLLAFVAKTWPQTRIGRL